MRLCEREKRDVIVYAFTGLDDDAYTWGEAAAICAAVYPMGQSLETGVYGEQMKDRRLMLYDGPIALSVGMGVSLDGGAPAYRITALEAWSHVRAEIERIPEGRRG